MPFPSLKALTSTAMLLGFLPFSASAQPAPKLTEQEAYAIGVEAYQYFYPAVLMEITRKVSTNTDAPGMGVMNEFQHMRTFPDASFRTVVRPNFDTLYSVAWLDLRKEPMIVSAPDTNGRYYLLPLIDMWTDVFAVPGKRTSGTQAKQFAVTFQGWSGKLPDGIERINAPTPYVWIIGRTQTNGAKDYDAVHAIQDGYKITPLSQWGQKPQQTKLVIDPSVDMKTPPLEQIRAMSAETFFTTAANLLKENPAHITDWSTLARLKHIGIEPGKSFSFDKASIQHV